MSKHLDAAEKAFEARLAAGIDELRELYFSLYGEDMTAFAYFMYVLRQSFEQRKKALREKDLERVADPDWYRSNGMLGMMMYTSCFGGTLNGVREKLDYIRENGVNYLHLMPLLDTVPGHSDGGYAVADFRKVRPDLGTMDDLEALTDACREQGISVCLDFVMNHTSEDHAWAKAARAGDISAMSRYFFYDNWDIPSQYEQTMPQVFPTTAPGSFTYLEDCRKIVMTSFYPYQWDLNYANPMVFNDMTDNLMYLVNRGIDVIRLDAVPYIWKELGTSCRNLPQVHTLVRIMRLACDIVCPGVLLLGEVVMEPVKVAPYFGTDAQPECHMLYNVTTMCTTWNTLATRDTRLLRYQMEQLLRLPREAIFQNYLRCHDDIGWGLDYAFLARFGMGEVSHKRYLNDYFTGRVPGSVSRGELYNNDPRLGDARLCGTTASLVGIEVAERAHDEKALDLAIKCDLMLHTWMLTQSGIPVLYSGDEVGQLNDYWYHGDPEKMDDSRYIHRGNFDHEAAKKRNEPGTVQERLFSGLKHLTGIRAAEPVFRADASFMLVEAEDDAVLALERTFGEQQLTAVFNFADRDASIRLYEGGTDLITGKKVEAGLCKLAPYDCLWIKK